MFANVLLNLFLNSERIEMNFQIWQVSRNLVFRRSTRFSSTSIVPSNLKSTTKKSKKLLYNEWIVSKRLKSALYRSYRTEVSY